MTGMQQCYVVDAANAPWKRSSTEGITFACQVLLSGRGRRPGGAALPLRRLPVGVRAHAPHVAVPAAAGRLDGFSARREASRSRWPSTTPTTTCRTDRSRCRGGHDMLVLHPKAGGIISMANHDARRQINLSGTHLRLPGRGRGVAAAAGRRALVVQAPDAARLRSGGGRRQVARACGARHACARSSDATRWCWRAPLSWTGRKSVRPGSATCAARTRPSRW